MPCRLASLPAHIVAPEPRHNCPPQVGKPAYALAPITARAVVSITAHAPTAVGFASSHMCCDRRCPPQHRLTLSMSMPIQAHVRVTACALKPFIPHTLLLTSCLVPAWRQHSSMHATQACQSLQTSAQPWSPSIYAQTQATQHCACPSQCASRRLADDADLGRSSMHALPLPPPPPLPAAAATALPLLSFQLPPGRARSPSATSAVASTAPLGLPLLLSAEVTGQGRGGRRRRALQQAGCCRRRGCRQPAARPLEELAGASPGGCDHQQRPKKVTSERGGAAGAHAGGGDTRGPAGTRLPHRRMPMRYSASARAWRAARRVCAIRGLTGAVTSQAAGLSGRSACASPAGAKD